jgi:hypothetical protein
MDIRPTATHGAIQRRTARNLEIRIPLKFVLSDSEGRGIRAASASRTTLRATSRDRSSVEEVNIELATPKVSFQGLSGGVWKDIKDMTVILHRKEGDGVNLIAMILTIQERSISSVAGKTVIIPIKIEFIGTNPLPIECTVKFHQDGKHLSVEQIRRVNRAYLPAINTGFVLVLAVLLLFLANHIDSVYTSNWQSLVPIFISAILTFFGFSSLRQGSNHFKSTDRLFSLLDYPEISLSNGSFKILSSNITTAFISILFIISLLIIGRSRFYTIKNSNSQFYILGIDENSIFEEKRIPKRDAGEYALKCLASKSTNSNSAPILGVIKQPDCGFFHLNCGDINPRLNHIKPIPLDISASVDGRKIANTSSFNTNILSD